MPDQEIPPVGFRSAGKNNGAMAAVVGVSLTFEFAQRG
jgi:hypothetical protein